MAIKHLTPIDMNKNEIQNAVFQNLAGAPSNPKEGQHYWNTTDKKMYMYNGTAWQEAGTTYELPTASESVLGGVKVGAGLSITDGVLSATGGGTADAVEWANVLNKPSSLGANITGATKTKITYDKYGLVTGGADLTPDDIPDLSSIYIELSQKGVAGGVVPLGEDSKIASTYLPSYVDDVVEAASQNAFPETGEAGKIYVALDTNKTYRWSGSTYVEISNSLDYATQAEAEAGTENTKVMTALRVKEAIAAQAGTVKKYAATFGDGSATSFTITHNLATRDVQVTVYEASSPYAEVIADIEHTSENTITIRTASAPTSGQYKVVIVG